MAKLYFRYGVMGAGKSTSLLQVVESYHRQSRGEKNCYILKSVLDTKDTRVVSRLGVNHDVDIHVAGEDNLYEMFQQIVEENTAIRCIVVDEVQFLEPHHVDELFMVAVNLDLPVICYGLRTDFVTKMFPASERLFALAHNLEKLKTICAYPECSSGKEAMFNARMLHGKFVAEGPQRAVDDKSTFEYLALCPQCYLEHVKKLA